MKILYVEDDEHDAGLVAHEFAIHAPEFQVDNVTSMRAALNRLTPNCPYDLVLSDVRLTDGNGLALLAHIRTQGWPVAVVLVTGGGDEDTVVTASRLARTTMSLSVRRTVAVWRRRCVTPMPASKPRPPAAAARCAYCTPMTK